MRILIVDDHEVVRRGVRSLLSHERDLEVCGEAVDGQDAVAKARELKPDVITMDISMPNLNGLEATREIRRILPEVQILILSQHDVPEMMKQALSAGANGYVVKSAVSTQLISALDKLRLGQKSFDGGVFGSAEPNIDTQEILQRSAAFEKALRESEERFRLTFEQAGVGMGHVAEDGYWLRVNKKLSEIVGYSEEELRNIRFQDITHPDDLAADLEQARRLVAGEIDHYSMQKRYIRKDGRASWTHLTVGALRDSDKKFKHYVTVVQDIDARKRAEEALQESRAQLALALESSNTAMFEWDLVAGRGRWNGQMTAIYGFTPDGYEMTDPDWRRIIHPEDIVRVWNEANEAFQKGNDFSFEFRTIRRDGSFRWILSKGRVVRDSAGKPLRLMGIHSDITDRKVAEQAVHASVRQQRALFELADRLHRAKSLEDVYCATFDAILAALECNRASILLYDHTGVMRFVSWRGLSDAYRKATEGHSPWTPDVKDPVPICMDSVEGADLGDSLKRVVLGEGIRALAFIPLVSHGKLIGKFMVYYNAPHAFTKDETELSLAIARQLAFGIERKRAERALRESEERFRAIVETTPECVKLVAPSGTLLHMNSVGLGMIGANRADMVVGKNVYELIAPEDRDRYRAFNERICAGERGSLEFDMLGVDGKRRHMETHAAPLWNPDGTVVQLGVTRDTTDRKHAEEALGEKARLIDLSNDAIVVRDPEDRITFWNEGAAEMYGYSREEALGRVSHTVLRTNFLEPLERIREKLLSEGRWSGELSHTRKDGSKITVSSRWSLERDASGNVACILESNRDISEIREAQHAQYRLAAIVESSDDAIVSKDLNGIIQSWNAGAERVFGFTAEEAVGQPITLIIPPELHDEEKHILSRLRAGERVDHFETVRQRKNGERRNISLSISPVRDSHGRVIGASKIARDITERKRIEQALKEAELSGRLLLLQDEERRRVARELHDGVGQLLAAMSMNIAMIDAEKTKLSGEAVRSVEENTALVQQAISEIRTLSHLLHPPFLDEVGLKSALMEYVHGFGERSNIQVTLDVSADVERLPRDYELSLFRVVQECLTNIHRHSGSATAQVRLTRTSGEIQLEVADQGRGMSAEIHQKFMEGRSAGVGLRGMRERVKQIGGTLELVSSGSGTCISVVLPLRDKLIVRGSAEGRNGEQPVPQFSSASAVVGARRPLN